MANTRLRILGLVERETAIDFRNHPTAKNAGLFSALDRQMDVAGIIYPVSRMDKRLSRLRYIHPDLRRWGAATNHNPWIINRRTQLAEKQLQAWDGNYDVIFQLHGLVAPGTHPGTRPYVVYTDNTFWFSECYNPVWQPFTGKKREALMAFERTLYQHAAFMFPMSKWVGDSLVEYYGCAPERVIPVGGGVNFVAHSLKGRRYDRQIALFVGVDFELKGGHTILRAWEQVHRQLPDAQLWIVGPRRPYALTTPGVRWIGRVGSREKLADLYMQATVFVMPSRFEPWGLVFHEAMAHGLPCIGSNHCAMPEIIQEGVNGSLIPPDDHAALADTLIRYLGNPDLSERTGKRAYRDVLLEHTWNHVVSRMLPYIEQAAGRDD